MTIHPTAVVDSKAQIGCNVSIGAYSADHRARLVGSNEVGLRRRGVDPGAVRSRREVYRLVFRSSLRREDALTLARQEFGVVPECARFLDFVAPGKRGIARHGRE